MLAWLFDATELTGLYLDLGCYHPIRWSNTYHLYQRGWRGLTVDVSPRYRSDWKRHRPRDRHIVAAITPTSTYGPVLYEQGDRHPATGHLISSEGAAPQQAAIVPDAVLSIDNLGDWWNEHRAPDLVSTDLEGMDRAVLLNYPFDELAPRVFVIEIEDIGGDPVPVCLSDNGYSPVARIGPSWIWTNRRRQPKRTV